MKKAWEQILEKYRDFRDNYEDYIIETDDITEIDKLNEQGLQLKEDVKNIFKDVVGSDLVSDEYLKSIKYKKAQGNIVMSLFENSLIMAAMFENESFYTIYGLTAIEVNHDNFSADYNDKKIIQSAIIAHHANKNYKEKEAIEEYYSIARYINEDQFSF